MTRRNEPAPWLYRAAVSILRTASRLLLWRVRHLGLEHIPASGPVVVVANHVSYVDPILIGLAVERRGRMVRYLAKRELFDHWFTGPVMRGADQILVDRLGDAGEALRHAETAMADGKLLVIFPEATIHPVFNPQGGKTGAARLALACNVPLVPVAAWGGQQVSTKGQRQRFGLRSHHVVRFGPPVDYAPTDTPADLPRRLLTAIAGLLEQAAAEGPPGLGPPVLLRDRR